MKMKNKVYAHAQLTDDFYAEQKRIRQELDAKIEKEKSDLWVAYIKSGSK